MAKTTTILVVSLKQIKINEKKKKIEDRQLLKVEGMIELKKSPFETTV